MSLISLILGKQNSFSKEVSPFSPLKTDFLSCLPRRQPWIIEELSTKLWIRKTVPLSPQQFALTRRPNTDRNE